MAVTVASTPVPHLPIGRGRPGTVQAGVGPAPWLPTPVPVAWFRGSPSTLHDADTAVIRDPG